MKPAEEILVVLPVFNDWASAWQLIVDLDAQFKTAGLRFDVLMVDDGSITARPTALPVTLQALGRVQVQELWCNCGHQRAIALGLAWAVAEGLWERFVIMDSDGEDRPADAVLLVQAHKEAQSLCAVFAERMRRSEGLLFQCGYHGYRLVHWLLTGIAVRVGNFSVIDRAVAGRIVHMAESWNHYAACVFKSRVPRLLVPTNRGHRYAGTSSMNFPALVAHGVSALSVHGDTVAVRLGAGALALAATLCLMAIGVGQVGGVNPLTACLVMVALNALLQTMAGVVSLAIITLNGRSQQGFIPGRDHACLTKNVFTYSN